MANDTQVTIVGNLTDDPTLRFTGNGTPVANFSIASTPRSFDRQTNDWKDEETLFLRCSVWKDVAENVADTLGKGTRVIAQGRLKSRTFDTKEGDRRTVFELDVDEIGPSLRYARAQVQKIDRRTQQAGGGHQQQAQGGWAGQQQGGWSNPNAAASPWDAAQHTQDATGAPFNA